MNFASLIKKIFKGKTKLIVIVGQTATGKSDLAVALAKKYNAEIISADSRQVYRGLDIGTAKITKEEMRNIPHHMIDVADPTKRFSVKEYKEQAEKIIKEIQQRGKNIIICGGTGMYIDALVFNQSFPNVAPNLVLRAELDQKTKDELYEKLQQLDRKRASSIDSHNKVRMIRALEIANTLGSVPQQNTSSSYHVIFIGLVLSKEELENNIKERVYQRLEQEKMIDEVTQLHQQGIPYQRMEELGLEYRYIAQYLQQQLSYPQMVETLITETKKFAKRQRTWFKRNKKIHWFHPIKEKNTIMEHVGYFLKK